MRNPAVVVPTSAYCADEVAEGNRTLLATAREYLFAGDLGACPGAPGLEVHFDRRQDLSGSRIRSAVAAG